MPIKSKIKHIEDKISWAKVHLSIDKKEVMHVWTKIATFEHIYTALINDVLREGLENVSDLEKEFIKDRKLDV